MKKTPTAIPWIIGVVFSVAMFLLLVLGFYLLGKAGGGAEPQQQTEAK